jgi:hypothetical protein
MQAPPPGQYPPPPNGAGPRPSMPPTPIPAHAHPYYHQSPQRTSHDLSFPLFIQFTSHSSPSCPVSNDDAPARWAWWPTAWLRWRTCSSCAHGRRCRARMMQGVVSHCCLFFFSAFCSEGLRSVRSSGLHGYCVWRARRLAWCSLALFHCSANVHRPSVHSMRARACIHPHRLLSRKENVLQRRSYKRNDSYAIIERKVSFPGQNSFNHRESRIARLSLIALSRCCCSGCSLPAATFPSPLVIAQEYPIQVKHRRD